MIRLSPLQTSVILALAKYRYLTNSQLTLLKIGHPSSVKKTTRFLSTFPMKGSILKVKRFPVHTRLGRREHLYALTLMGWKIACERCPGFFEHIPPVTSWFDGDFFHRRACITFHILLDLSLAKLRSMNVGADRYENYFDMTGANHRKTGGEALHSKTRMNFANGGFFIPDGVCILKSSKTEERGLFSIECVFGNKTQRTLHQIQRHIQALNEGVLTRRYEIPEEQKYLALFFFDDPALLQRVMKKLNLSSSSWFAPFRNHFLFATIRDIHRDILNCWRKVGDSQFLFNFLTGKKSFRVR